MPESEWETDDSSVGEIGESPPLLPVPDGISHPRDELCDTCKALDLNPKRFVVLQGDKEWGQWNVPDELDINLGNVEDMKKKTSCPFCRLVLRSLSEKEVPTHENGNVLKVSMSWNTNGPNPDPSAPWSHRPEVRVLRPYLQTQDGGFPETRQNLFPEITLLANDSPTDSTEYFVRPYDPEKIDFNVARRWISLCNTHHGKTCKKNPILKDLEKAYPNREIPEFKCIDVEERCVANLPPGSRYATLSYVWGAAVQFKAELSNIKELEKPQAFDDPKIWTQIPQTIKDAIHIAKQIGMRYLWVDNLCIVQDDPVHKKETIKTMDLVYNGSDLVITTAGSDTAYAGVSGLEPGTRQRRQPIEQISPGFRLAFKSMWANSTEDRPYFKRGWTFQESHFAKRSLIFIDGKVVFRCQGVDAWEEHLIERAVDIKGARKGNTRGFEGGDIGEFEGLIQNYSERLLSYEDDVYNAFAGVSRQLMVKLDTDLCHGMPTRYFDWFLLWRPLSLQTRRLSNDGKLILAPSWSWSGWVGTSWPHMWDWYNRSIKSIGKAIRKRTWIIWYQRDGHDSTICKRLVRHQDGSDSKSESKNFYGSRIQKRFDMDCSTTKPTDVLLTGLNPPHYVEDILSNHKGSGFLQFWTVSLTLQLKEPTSKNEERGPTDKRHRLGIFGRSKRELGIIHVQPSWLEGKTLPEKREFILICEGRDKRAENGNIDDEKGWRYMVMLLEWVGKQDVRTATGSISNSEEPMYAERVAVGWIRKKGVDEALDEGAVWKEIILG